MESDNRSLDCNEDHIPTQKYPATSQPSSSVKAESSEESTSEESSDMEDSQEKLQKQTEKVLKEVKKKTQKRKRKNAIQRALERETPMGATEPYYPTALLKATPDVLDALRKQFEHESFRPYQEEVIMRILSGQSTVAVLSRDSGKSLCYQLPAYLYSQKSDCIALVITPTISLIEDQIRNLPRCLTGATLHYNQSGDKRRDSLQEIKQGGANVIFLTPEGLLKMSAEISSSFRVCFACVDEAHCLIKWSHNIRSSYLTVPKVLLQEMNIRPILALTATATESTALKLTKKLEISSRIGLCYDFRIPKNLCITVSHQSSSEKKRDMALLQCVTTLMNKEGCESIIVYCRRRDDTERISEMLNGATSSDEQSEDESLPKSRKRKQSPTKMRRMSKKCKRSWSAAFYHGSMSGDNKKKVQDAFIDGSLNIVVATVAFAMGLNKADVRAIIHYNMPKSFESFVQEIGRAGRDGLPAYCHVFIDKEGKEQRALCGLIKKEFPDHDTVKDAVTTISKLPVDTSLGEDIVPIPARFHEACGIKNDEVLITLLRCLELEELLEVVRIHQSDTYTCIIKRSSNLGRRSVWVSLNKRIAEVRDTQIENVRDVYKVLESAATTLDHCFRDSTPDLSLVEQIEQYFCSGAQESEDAGSSTLPAQTLPCPSGGSVQTSAIGTPETTVLLEPSTQSAISQPSNDQSSGSAGSSTQTSTSQPAEQELNPTDDLLTVTEYLLDLDNDIIYNLGLVLGLGREKVLSLKDKSTFRDDVIAAWLRKEDDVIKRGVPTWQNLVKALRNRRVRQNGIADKIEKCYT